MHNKSVKAKIISTALITAFAIFPVFGCSSKPAEDTAGSIAQAAQSAASAAGETIKTVSDATTDKVESAINAVGSAAQSAVNAAGEAAQSAVKAAGDAVKNVSEEASNAVQSAAASVGDKTSGTSPVNLSGFIPIADGFSLTKFTAQTMDGQTFTQDNLADKDVTAINFWSTTCPPCVNEMPDIAAFQKALPENVAFITACLDADYNADAMKKILTESGYAGINLIGYEGDIATVANAVSSIPTTVFVNSDGVFVGGMLIGGGDGFNERFTKAFNDILENMGKELIK